MKTASKTLSLIGATSPFSQKITKDFFGADCNSGFGSQFGASPLQDGVGNPAVLQTVRLWDNGLKWTQINTAAGTYNFKNLDKWVAASQAMGYDLLYVFGATPTFIASSCANASGCSNVQGFTNNCCPPTDVNSDGSGTDATFKAFVTAIINHVGPGVIKYWELWNEQDSSNFWNGTMQQAVRMGQDAAAIIRSLDPTAQIVSPSFHGPSASGFFVNYCQTSVNGIPGWKNFDIVNCHMRATDETKAGNKNANVDPTCFYTAYNDTIAALSTLKNSGIDLTGYPLWDDEHGYIPGQGGSGFPPPLTDPHMLAAYVSVGLILRASVNLQKQCYYVWTGPNPTQSLQSNESGTAWDNTANLLIGKTVNGSLPATGYSLGNNQFGPPVYTVTVNNGAGMFVWDQSQTCDNSTGKEVCTFSTFKYPSGYTKWQDVFGGSGTLSGGTVQIGCCPLYLS